MQNKFYQHKLTNAFLELIKEGDSVGSFYVLDNNLNRTTTQIRLSKQIFDSKAVCKMENVKLFKQKSL